LQKFAKHLQNFAKYLQKKSRSSKICKIFANICKIFAKLCKNVQFLAKKHVFKSFLAQIVTLGIESSPQAENFGILDLLNRDF